MAHTLVIAIIDLPAKVPVTRPPYGRPAFLIPGGLRDLGIRQTIILVCRPCDAFARKSLEICLRFQSQCYARRITLNILRRTGDRPIPGNHLVVGDDHHASGIVKLTNTKAFELPQPDARIFYVNHGQLLFCRSNLFVFRRSNPSYFVDRILCIWRSNPLYFVDRILRKLGPVRVMNTHASCWYYAQNI
jgi:hypothetical protein